MGDISCSTNYLDNKPSGPHNLFVLQINVQCYKNAARNLKEFEFGVEELNIFFIVKFLKKIKELKIHHFVLKLEFYQ